MKKNSKIKEEKIKEIDKEFERKIRPLTFNEFFGQEDNIKNLKIFIDAAKKRKEPLDHILLHGPPGLGKTTLAHIIANEMGVSIKTTTGPVIERPGDLIRTLIELEENDILFIDEIHRLPRIVEEYLYPAMEDFKIDIVIDKGPNAKSHHINLKKFTLIGATTREGLLTAPLRDRFEIKLSFDYYDINSLIKIIERTSSILKVEIQKEAIEEIAKRSRGTPRIANALLKRIRDFADVENNGIITYQITIKAFDSLKIDEKGLNDMDRKILLTIINKFNGGPVGLKTLSTAINEEPDTIEEVYEPYLVKEGFLNKTKNGRVATTLAYEHLKLCSKAIQLELPFKK